MQSHLETNSAVPPGRPSGPLSAYIPRFTAALDGRGFARTSMVHRVRVVRALDQQMRKHRMRIEDLTEERIERFFRDRGRSYSKQIGECAALRSLLGYLRKAQAVPLCVSHGETSPIGQLQASSAQYLRELRGLRPATLEQYLFRTRRFLAERFGKGALSLDELNAQDMLLLARLGLHASEVVRMMLEDIDWEAGELTIRGKGGASTSYPGRETWASPWRNTYSG